MLDTPEVITLEAIVFHLNLNNPIKLQQTFFNYVLGIEKINFWAPKQETTHNITVPRRKHSIKMQ